MRFSGTLCVALVALAMSACASLPNSDPLSIDVAGIEPVPSEGMELRLAVSVRIQNPNDFSIDYSGAALNLDLNGRRLASGVSAEVGSVPRYGETVLTIPVTVSAFNVARQLMGFANDPNPEALTLAIRGKLEGGLFRTRRFRDEATLDLGGDVL